jgi:hypothetical protein
MRNLRRTITVVAGSVVLAVAGCGLTNGPYTVSVTRELHPRLTPQDAVAISRTYLDAQTPQLATPEMHIPPTVLGVWAVRADEAAGIDGCIPPGRGDHGRSSRFR